MQRVLCGPESPNTAKPKKDFFTPGHSNLPTERKKKRTMRNLWTIKINAAARENGTTYSKLINKLLKANIALDRKILADLAEHDPEVFKKIVAEL